LLRLNKNFRGVFETIVSGDHKIQQGVQAFPSLWNPENYPAV